MANDRPKVHTITTPRGTFVFPRLNEPDTKFKAEGEYSVKLKLDGDSAAQLAAKLQPLLDAAVTKANEEFKKLKPEQRKKLGKPTINSFCVEELADDETPTGYTIFNFKMKASGVTKLGKAWSRKPAIFDAKGTVMSNPPPIWGGTVGRVSFEVVEGGYFVPGTGAAGISLSLVAVQIIELRSGAQRDAKGYGFSAEEGFEQPTERFSDETTSDETTSSDDSADF